MSTDPRPSIRVSDSELERLLAEDAPYGDLTAQAIVRGTQSARCMAVAREPMRVCGTEEAARLFELSGASARTLTPTGADVEAGAHLLAAEGDVMALFRAWKLAQIVVEQASGVATATRDLADAAEQGRPGTTVAATRKNAPGSRALGVRAALAGGATMHRRGASETIQIFPQYLQATGLDLAEAIVRAVEAEPERIVCAEVTDLEDARIAAIAGAAELLVDKASPSELVALVSEARAIQPAIRIAAAGGVTVYNAAAYAGAGADVLVTSAMFFSLARDVDFSFGPI